jgi:hypothetical protein
MEKTPDGTPVGVDDPYEHAGPCDHLTGDGRCRYALAYAGNDPAFAADRRADDYECLVADEDADWPDCPHYRSTTDGKRCARCGLEEVRIAHDASRPLVEEHHLSYGDGGGRGGRSTADDAGDRPDSTDEQGSGDRGRAREAGPAGPGDEPPTELGRGPTDLDGCTPSEVDGGRPAEGGDDREDPGGRDAEVTSHETPSHEITVGLCRWCHAKVHKGFARVDDDANPDPEAIAERESRRGAELGEYGFSTARERRRDE